MRQSALGSDNHNILPVFSEMKGRSGKTGAIALVPAEGVNIWVVDIVKIALQGAFCEDVSVIALPEGEWPRAMLEEKGQVRASGLIKQLEPLRLAFDRVLGVVSTGLSHPGVNHVFGLTEPETRVSVMSLCHLGRRGEALIKMARRASKTAIHELGHSYGLRHCGDHKCVMFFSFNLSDTDYKESRFCKKCGEELSLLKSGAYDRKEV